MNDRPDAAFDHPRFALIRQIGAGGMGVVFEAHDRERDVRVALKLLPAAKPQALVRFKNEFRSIAEIVHPTLVPLYELISDGEQWFFTMELIDGVDLLTWLHPAPRSLLWPEGVDRTPTVTRDSMRVTGEVDAGAPAATRAQSTPVVEPLTADAERQLRTLFEQLANGVTYLHEAGVIHRDLKPSNVLVRRNGEPVVLDFGLAATLRGDELDDEISGTLLYMAPEQIRGHVPTPAVDWYAFGVMLYEALTGVVPFRGSAAEVIDRKLNTQPLPPAALMPSVPRDLNQLCIDLLAQAPQDRPSGFDVAERVSGRAVEGAPRQPDRIGGSELALVGRERLLADLHALLGRVSQGAAATVHLHGHSGMGKSLLLGRFLEDASAERGVVVLAGRCFEQESMPFKALDGLMDRLARYLQNLPWGEVEALMPPDIAALGLMFPALLNVEAIASAPQDVLSIPERRELRQRAFAALRALFKKLGDKRLLILSIDDLQWGDVDSATFLADLVDSSESPRLMLLVTYRTEARQSACIRALADRPQSNAGERHTLEVAPLNHEEIRRLIEGVLPAEIPHRREWIDRIAADSGGSPYFAIELAGDLKEGARDRKSRSGETTLDDVLWNRIQELPESSIRLLEAVSAAGQPLRAEYAYAGGALTDRGQGPIVTLRGERLIRTTGPALSDDIEVYHDRIRETVTARMDPVRRTNTHARLAHAMESADQVDPERIGRHFESAGLAPRASHHYARAAERAVAALAFERGAVLYRRAAELRAEDDDEKTRLLIGLAQALANAGRGSEAAPIYRAAAQRVNDDDAFDLRHNAATQYCISGHVDEGRAIFRDLLRAEGLHVPTTSAGIVLSLAINRARLRARGLSTATTAGPLSTSDQRRMDLLWSCSTALSAVDVLGVAAMQTRCLLLALRAGDPRRIARSLAWEAVMTSVSGSRGAPRVAALLERADGVAASIDLPQARAVVLLAKGWAAFLQVRLRESIRCCEEAEQLLRDHCTGVWWEIGTLRTMIAWALVHCGDFARLMQVAPGFLRDATERGDLFTKTNVATVAMAHLHLAADDPSTARQAIGDAMGAWPRSGFHMQHVAELYGTVNVLLYNGQGEEAYARMEEAWPRMRRALHLANQFNRVMMRDLRARTALAADERRSRGLARVAAREAARIAREETDWARPFAWRLDAAVAMARERSEGRDQAIALLRRAADGFDAHDLSLQAAATRLRLGTIVEGSDGSALVEEASRFMQRQSIRRVDRITDMFVPPLTR